MAQKKPPQSTPVSVGAPANAPAKKAPAKAGSKALTPHPKVDGSAQRRLC